MNLPDLTKLSKRKELDLNPKWLKHQTCHLSIGHEGAVLKYSYVFKDREHPGW